jgi:hypothetical protein
MSALPALHGQLDLRAFGVHPKWHVPLADPTHAGLRSSLLNLCRCGTGMLAALGLLQPAIAAGANSLSTAAAEKEGAPYKTGLAPLALFCCLPAEVCTITLGARQQDSAALQVQAPAQRQSCCCRLQAAVGSCKSAGSLPQRSWLLLRSPCSTCCTEVASRQGQLYWVVLLWRCVLAWCVAVCWALLMTGPLGRRALSGVMWHCWTQQVTCEHVCM